MGVQDDDNDRLTPTWDALMRHARTRRILGKLHQHLDDIIGTDKVRLVIDCAGKNVKLTRTLHDDN
jgi:hypothetical protein